MSKRTNIDRVVPASHTPDVLKCFDTHLRVRRHLFADAVSVCHLAVGGSPVITRDQPSLLRFGDHIVDLSGIVGWLDSRPADGGWTFYIHLHDNIAVELVRIESRSQASFPGWSRWFRTRPAAEGGSNLLGVVGLLRAWMLLVENDNQGGFRIDFFGSTEACQSLRLCLDQQRHAEPSHARERRWSADS